MTDNVRALAHREQPTGGALAMWDAEQIHVLRTLICPDATDAEFALFGQVCQRTGLDPFAKQIYGIKRKGKLTIQTGIDGFRLQAQRSGDYAGQEGPQWCGEDGVWRDVWLSKDHPSAARVGVYRKGWTRPGWGVATWSEYAQMYNGQPQGQWGTMPANMLAKCAESQALRKAFPAELSGMYSRDEMAQAENEDAPTPIDIGTVRGEVMDAPPSTAWREPHESRWNAGVVMAQEIGAKIPPKPPAGKAGIEALNILGANITARRSLLDEAREVVEASQAAGSDTYEFHDGIKTWPDDDIREMIVTIQQTIEMADAMDAAGVPA